MHFFEKKYSTVLLCITIDAVAIISIFIYLFLIIGRIIDFATYFLD